MKNPTDLYLYEQLLLLVLRNEEGTPSGTFPEYAIAGSILAELELLGRIGRMRDHPTEVGVLDATPTGDPVIDECLAKITSSKKHFQLKHWVSKLSSIPRLRHKAAQQLCDRGILKADERKIMMIFKQQTYPEINPAPEQAILAELEHAIFENPTEVEPRLVTLIALAHSSGLLSINLGKQKIKAHDDRIKAIIAGNRVGEATKETIQTLQAVLFTAMITPMILS